MVQRGQEAVINTPILFWIWEIRAIRWPQLGDSALFTPYFISSALWIPELAQLWNMNRISLTFYHPFYWDPK